MRLLVKTFIFCLCFASAFGQSLEGDFIPFGQGYMHQTAKDASLSPVSYSGSLGTIKGGYYFQNKKWINLLDITGFVGFQRPTINREESLNRTFTFGGRIQYQLAYKVYEQNDWSVFSGIYSHNLWDFRTHNRYANNRENFTGLFSLGVSSTLQKPFSIWGQNFAGQYILGLPIGSYYLRPSYILPNFNGGVGSKGFAFWGDVFIVDSRTDLIWILKNGNQIRLGYYWEYAELDLLNQVQIGGHQLTLSTVFRF